MQNYHTWLWMVAILMLVLGVVTFLQFDTKVFHYSDSIPLRSPRFDHAPSVNLTRKFCTLPDSHEYWADKKLWQSQHPASCAESKFIIITPARAGLGAVAHGLVHIIHEWSNKGYIVLLDIPFGHGFWHFKNASSCPNNQGGAWECYFEPISNCTIKDALARAGVSTLNEVPSYGKTPHPDVLKFSGYTWLHHHKFGDLTPRGVFDIDSTNAFYLRYLFRFNAQTVARLMPLFSTLPVVDPRTSVALPIRGSDKCHDGQHEQGKIQVFETACMPLSLYLDAVRELQAYHPEPVKTVILTSEDSRYIEAATEVVHKTHEWLLTMNPLDDHPGTGRLGHVAAASHWDQFVGLFSTVELLMRSNRYIVNCASHFHALMLLYRLGNYCGQDNVNSPLIFCLESQRAQRFKICATPNCSSHGLRDWKEKG